MTNVCGCWRRGAVVAACVCASIIPYPYLSFSCRIFGKIFIHLGRRREGSPRNPWIIPFRRCLIDTSTRRWYCWHGRKVWGAACSEEYRQVSSWELPGTMKIWIFWIDQNLLLLLWHRGVSQFFFSFGSRLTQPTPPSLNPSISRARIRVYIILLDEMNVITVVCHGPLVLRRCCFGIAVIFQFLSMTTKVVKRSGNFDEKCIYGFWYTYRGMI